MKRKINHKHIFLLIIILGALILAFKIGQASIATGVTHDISDLTVGGVAMDADTNGMIDSGVVQGVTDTDNNGIVDQSDTVIDLSGNMYMYTTPPLLTTTGFINGQWTGTLPQGSVPNIPNNAEYAIIEYTMSAVAPTCNWVVLNFHGQDPRPANGGWGSVNLQEVGGQRVGQVIIPLRPGQGNFYFQYQYSGTGCTHALALQGYIM